VQIDPENAQALNNLAVAYEGIGEFEKARDAYARALRVDKSNQHIQKNYSRFVEFYSRNRKREQQLEELAKAAEASTPPAAEAEEPEAPIELSRPEDPPRPGEIPVSDVPPDPVPPIPPPPPGGLR
jgi:tetratricopeptide (TPR) repeat protein